MKNARKSKIFKVGVGAAIIGLALTGCSGSSSASRTGGETGSESKPTNVIASAFYAPTHAMAKSLTDWGGFVEESSNNSLMFEWFYGESLVKPAETPGSMADGILDVGYVVPSYTPAEYPADAWASLLGYGNDPRPVVGLLAAAAATMELGFVEPALQEELRQSGVVPLIPRFQNWDNYNLLCTSPVTNLDEAKGKRVRTGGEAWARVATELGMIPVTVSGSEMYEALERGVVDCFMGGENDMSGQGIWEVASEYTTIQVPGWNSIALATGKNFFEGLSVDQQGALTGTLSDFVDAYYTNYLAEQYQFFRTGTDLYGIEFHEADKGLNDAVEDYYAGLRTSMIEQAPEVISDPAGTIELYDELLEKWTQIVLDLGFDPGTADRLEWAQSGDDTLEINIRPWADTVQTEIFDKYIK